jgi:type II secretory pathway pseudopilin PulG
MFAVPIAVLGVIAGAAGAYLIVPSGSSSPRVAAEVAQVSAVGSAVSLYRMSTSMHRDVAILESRTAERAARAARRRNLAALAEQSPAPSPSPGSPPSSGGGDAADSPLGVCIRDAEEGGSYAWGPGNGGGAYQFALGTWERYGGAASEFGVAGPGYQDQIFDNAIAAGGASNWTDYDGC